MINTVKRGTICSRIVMFLKNKSATTVEIAKMIRRHRSIAGGLLRHLESRGVVEVIHRAKSGDWTDCSVWRLR